MNAICSVCAKPLKSTGSGPEWMNSEQWDASKAGDWFAPCDKATHPNGNCYFSKSSQVAVALSPTGAVQS